MQLQRVAVNHSVGKLPSLKAIAPTQSEPPFVAAQAFVLIAFIVLGVLAARRFHPNVGVGALRAA